MLMTAPSLGYSADVRIDLFVNGQRFPVAQAGRGQLIFKKPFLAPAAEGEVVLTIDGNPRRWFVRFHDQIAASHIIMADFRDAV
jgi:hypothetical protein